MYSWMHSLASSIARSRDSRGSTVSSACSSETPGLEGFLAAEASGDLERLAAVLAEAREHADEEVGVGDRLADLQRGVPGGEQVQVVLVEIGDRLGVVDRQLLVGDVIHPCAHDLADKLTARLAADRLGDHADGVLGLDEAKGHWRLQGEQLRRRL